MKKILLFTLSALLLAFSTNAQIAINEFLPADGRVELKNMGSTAVDVSNYQLCSFPTYNAITSLTLESGNLMLEPGAILVVSGHTPPNAINDELGLYTSASFSSSDAMIDYVEWGSTGHMRSSVAVEAGIWQTGDFIPAPEAGMSVTWDGTDDSVSSWSNTASTFGQENSMINNLTEEGENNSISVYPTLIENQLTVTGIESGFNLTIYSLGGQIVFNERVATQTAELPSFSAGHYVAQVTSGAINKSFRVIKN